MTTHVPSFSLLADSSSAFDRWSVSFAWLRVWWRGLLTVPVDTAQVARLLEAALRQPTLRHWLLVAASEAPRLRRTLLARAIRESRGQWNAREVVSALEELSDASLLHGVVDALLHHHGLAPLAPSHRVGRVARVRLGDLAERWQPSAA